MHQHVSVFLALRYLRPKKSFVSLITLLSIVGPILGVAVLITVIAVMAGFNRDIRKKILGMQAHIRIYNRLSGNIKNPEPLLARLRTYGVAASPVVEGPVLMQYHRQILAKYVRGILPKTERNVSDIHQSMVAGHFAITENEVLIGRDLSIQTGLGLGDKFIIHSPEKLNRMVGFKEDGSISKKSPDEIYVPEEVTVAGIFSMGMYEYDSSLIIMHLEKADDLFGLDWGAATSVQIKTGDPFNLKPLQKKIAADPLFAGLRTVPWQEANRRLFGALRVEKNLMFFLLIFIVVVAAFGIAGTLITVVIQKTREIGVLKALGATPAMILSVFCIQGVLVGLLGTLLGTLLGLEIVQYRNQIAAILARIMGTEIFPRDLYHLSQIPAVIMPMDIIQINGLALLICILAALIPAFYAASLQPTAALRNEGN